MPKKKTHKQYLQDLKDKGITAIPLEEYRGNSTKILHDFGCEHEPNLIIPNAVLRGQGCPECYGNKKKTHDQYLKQFLGIHPKGELLEGYKGCMSKILHDFGCGHEPHFINPNSVLRGVGCSECAGKKKKTHEGYVKQFLELYTKGEVLGVYKGSKTKILHDFGCGHTPNFVSPNNVLRGAGCPICNESKGEKKVREYLKHLNIEFKVQHSFEGLKHKQPLRVDFYIPLYNVVVEYQGRQHYLTVRNKFFGGEKALKLRQQKDQLKRNYCKEQGITLIEVPCFDERIEQRLSSALFAGQTTHIDTSKAPEDYKLPECYFN